MRFWLTLACLLPAALAGDRPTIRLERDAGGQAVIRVTGVARVPGDPRELLTVSVEGAGAPMLGAYGVADGSVTFAPRFPLQPGVRYRAVWNASSSDAVSATFEIPKAESPRTIVEQVYPTADRLPENLLKFYVHFSAPMSRGESSRRVRLLDDAGRSIELPFLELDEELWDREWRRLTAFFDPGRVKRGLTPHAEAGPPLEAGRRYTLVIDAGWPDAAGNRLGAEFRKEFAAGPADRDPIDIKAWRVAAPAPGTRGPLTVEFPEPLDRALLERLLEVLDPAGRAIGGSIAVDLGETRWRFTPSEAWRPGEYRLRAGKALEDLAGNKIGRAFDVDVFERVERRITADSAVLPFRVR